MMVIKTKDSDSRRAKKHYVPGGGKKTLYYVYYRKKGNVLVNTLIKAHQPPNRQEYVMMRIIDELDHPGIGKTTSGNMYIELRLIDYDGKCLNCSNPTIVHIYTNVGSDAEEVDDAIRDLLKIPSLESHRQGILPLRGRKKKPIKKQTKRCICKK